jgi:hypothetical protein
VLRQHRQQRIREVTPMGSDSEAVRQVFGLALRQLRNQAGMSLRELGQRSLYDYSRISRVERGEHLIDPEHVPAIDEALGTGGLLALLRSLAPGTADSAVGSSGMKTLPAGGLHVDDGDSVTLELRTPDGRIVRVSLSRREFAQLLTTGMLRGLLPAGVADDLDQADRVSKALDEPRRVDQQVLDYFHTVLAEHFTADKMLGPRQLLGPVLAQIEVLDGLRRHARPGTAEPTLRLLAQYAEFGGWLHQDAGDTTAAMFWSDRAAQWAQAVGDYQMVAYMLVRKSNIALLDDAVNVVDLAAAARKVPGPVSPKLHALAAQQEARGWALAGEADQFQHRLDTAANLLREHPNDVDETAPVYLHHYDLDTLEEQSASGYRACGKADTAVAILERKIAATPDHMHRDQGHQLAKLANTVLATEQPDPERAVSLGLRCIGTARSTGSARIVKELRTLDRVLARRWPTFAGTAEFHEALADAA